MHDRTRQALIDFTAPPRHRKTDPPTSRAAWIDNLPRAGTQRRRIYDFVFGCGDYGATCSEIVDATGIKQCSASTRISELLEKNFIKDSGRRDGPDGSAQRVVSAVRTQTRSKK